MATDTTYTLDQFLADTRATIRARGVPAGLAEIRDHLGPRRNRRGRTIVSRTLTPARGQGPIAAPGRPRPR